jgi:hypothetical protein
MTSTDSPRSHTNPFTWNRCRTTELPGNHHETVGTKRKQQAISRPSGVWVSNWFASARTWPRLDLVDDRSFGKSTKAASFPPSSFVFSITVLKLQSFVSFLCLRHSHFFPIPSFKFKLPFIMARYAFAYAALAATGAMAAQGAAYAQCGGQGWSGATACVDGYHCAAQNDWYSQCIPGAGGAVATAPKTAAAKTTMVTMARTSAGK